MKTKITEKKDHTLTVEVEVEPQVLRDELDEGFRHHMKQFALPGFRKGKVPLNMAKKYLTDEALLPHALEHVVPESLSKALKGENITPLTTPQIEIKEFEIGQPVVFAATFEVKPEIEIKDYQGVKAQVKKTEIKESDLNEILDRLREMAFRKTPVTEDRGLKTGDFALIDFASFRNGKPVSNGSAQNFEVEMMADKFIPGFMDNLTGMKKGEEKEFEVIFPADYPNKKLRNQQVDFRVKVLEIKQKELPELNDDFAKEVSSFATLKEYREDLKKNLEEREKGQSDSQIENQGLQHLYDQVKEVPNSYLGYQREYLYRDFMKQLEWRGENLENYLAAHNLSLENLSGILTAQAELLAKEELILDAVARAEKLEVAAEEAEEEIKAFAERTHPAAAKVKEAMEKEGTTDFFLYSLLKKKVRKFLREKAQVEYQKAEEAEKLAKAHKEEKETEPEAAEKA